MNQHASNVAVTNNIVRWISSNAIPFDDVLQELVNDGVITTEQMSLSSQQKKVEQAEFLAQYIKARQKRGYSDEEMFEMRAAFGPGETVVDVFTGQTIRL